MRDTRGRKSPNLFRVKGAGEPKDRHMNSRKRIPWMEGARSFNHCKGLKIGTI